MAADAVKFGFRSVVRSIASGEAVAAVRKALGLPYRYISVERAKIEQQLGRKLGAFEAPQLPGSNDEYRYERFSPERRWSLKAALRRRFAPGQHNR